MEITLSKVKRRVFWIFTMAMTSLSVSSFAAEEPQQKNGSTEAKSVERVNRSILTVGREVFTAVDAVALLMIWNSTRVAGEKEVKLETQWLRGFSFPDLVIPDIETMKKVWPDDVRVFFQLALIWVDVKKLNLFVSREQEITTVLGKFNDRKTSDFSRVEPILVSQVFGSSEKSKREWIEAVIRTRTFYRVRGSFERNKNLFNVGWYWHKSIDGVQ